MQPDFDTLIQNLNDPSHEVRLEAVIALGKLNDPRAAPYLVDALRNWDERVVKAAGEALLQLGEPAISQLILALDDSVAYLKKNAQKALVPFGLPAFEQLVIALSEGKISRIDVMIETIGLFGEIALPILIETLLESNENWHSATTALSKIGEPALIVLLKLTESDNFSIAEKFLKALSYFKDDRAFERMLKALGSENIELVAVAIDALGMYGDERAIPFLQQIVDTDKRTNQEGVNFSSLAETSITRIIEEW